MCIIYVEINFSLWLHCSQLYLYDITYLYLYWNCFHTDIIQFSCYADLAFTLSTKAAINANSITNHIYFWQMVYETLFILLCFETLRDNRQFVLEICCRHDRTKHAGVIRLQNNNIRFKRFHERNLTITFSS